MSASPRIGPLSRDLGTARKAFDDGNQEMSRLAHNSNSNKPYSEPGHNGAEGTFRMCLLLGGFEGIVTSTVIIAALSSIHVPCPTIISVVIGCLIALSVGFGLRDFIRYRSDVIHFQRERNREKWELKNYADGERKEMVELYVAKGLRPEDAVAAINAMSKPDYEEFFVDLMMAQELMLKEPDGAPSVNGVCTFLASLLLGSIPIIIFWLKNLVYPKAPVVSLIDGGFTEVLALLHWDWTWEDLSHHPFTVACVTAIVTTVALFATNRKFLPHRNQPVKHISFFVTYCCVSWLGFVATRSLLPLISQYALSNSLS